MPPTPNLPNTTELPDNHLPPPYSTTPPTEPSPSKSAEALNTPISRHETEPLPPYQREPGQTGHDDANTPCNDQSAEGVQEHKEKPKWYKRGGVVAGAIEGTLLVLVFALVS
ncbi:hypothetical protein IQ07DRAFT_602539 [Pyrenochaeta sp. DS3sAY3a]|nr:hypothetical protein IQ07DRAFT_602539 [Pyrenochaeta sp. DS3sAY3a]